jgi:hypothetical protein
VFAAVCSAALAVRSLSDSAPSPRTAIALNVPWMSTFSRAVSATCKSGDCRLEAGARMSPGLAPASSLQSQVSPKKPLKRSHPFCRTPMKFVQAVPKKLTVSTQATWMPAQASLRKRARP